jgi:hypothetical protein
MCWSGSPSGGPFRVVLPLPRSMGARVRWRAMETARVQLRALRDEDLDALVELDGFEAVETSAEYEALPERPRDRP